MTWLAEPFWVASIQMEWKMGAKPASRATMVTTSHLADALPFNTFLMYPRFLGIGFEAHVGYASEVLP